MDKRETEKRGVVGGGSPKPEARGEVRGVLSATAPARQLSAAAAADDDLEQLATICGNDWDEV